MSIIRSRIKRLEQKIAAAGLCDTLIVIQGGHPSNVVTPEMIAEARAEVGAINMSGRGTGKIHVVGGLPPLFGPMPPGLPEKLGRFIHVSRAASSEGCFRASCED